MTAMRFLLPGTALLIGLMLLLMPWWLDATECAAQFVNLAFVRQFLPFGEFDQLKNFVQLIQRMPEVFGDFRGMRHRLADGRDIGGTKICRLGPLPLLGAALLVPLLVLMLWRALLAFLAFLPLRSFGTLMALRTAFRLRRRLAFGNRFRHSFTRRGGRRNIFRRHGIGIGGFLGMRFAKITGGIRLGFSRVFHACFGRRRLGAFLFRRKFLGGGVSFVAGWARYAATATTTATTAAASTRAAAGAAGG